MLFSNPELASYLSENFECAWEGLRPAPKVHVDFGNGHELHRTLNGNVATWFCTPDGEVINGIPGLVDVPTFRRLAGVSRAWFSQINQSEVRDRPTSRQEHLPAIHAEVAGPQLLSLRHEPGFIASSKSGVESGLRVQLRPQPDSEDLVFLDQQPSANPAPQVELRPSLAKRVVEFDLKSQVKPPKSASNLQPSAPVEVPADHAQAAEAHSSPADVPVSSLAMDTRYTLATAYPALHRILESRPLSSPRDLELRVFREILHVDLEDPFLGLAPQTLGGDLGRVFPQDAH